MNDKKGENTQRIIIDDFKGLWDEEAISEIHHINRRKMCIKHKWINASLSWSNTFDPMEGYYLSIEERHAEKNFCREWGTGYGGIRFCLNCKWIDCIHLFIESWTYEKKIGPYYSHCEVVKKCKICEKKIHTSGCAESKPSAQATDIVSEVAKELNLTWELGHMGSFFFTELPVFVADILDKQGEEQAKEYARSVFVNGECNRYTG